MGNKNLSFYFYAVGKEEYEPGRDSKGENVV